MNAVGNTGIGLDLRSPGKQAPLCAELKLIKQERNIPYKGIVSVYVLHQELADKLLMFVASDCSKLIIGVFLAIERVDIMGMAARKHLNNLVFYVLNPALVGSNLAKFITVKSLVML
ncbi:hypothetical protein DKX38_017957 [Salix brachista]|uniref:Uncharacterized protein n=1 Tax=Salix brachista TaxID=2182728 RepID=A0A5N5KXR0_9ROSI|nr:hypothetical protein DKX38_017957 [Salix brachista]